MIVATLQTERFTFDAYSDTVAGALALLERAWAAHRGQTGARYSWEDVRGDIDIRDVTPGTVWRDGSLLT